MIVTHTLFLDETKPNSNFPAFTLAGVIIKDTNYDNVKTIINQMKTTHFGSITPILHEIDIRKREGIFLV